MGYFIRVLAEKYDNIQLSEIEEMLALDNIRGSATVDDGTEVAWSQLLLKDADGNDVAVVERNIVSPGSLAEEELDEFSEEVEEYKPENAARWLINYFKKVKVIYAFQILNSAYEKNGWEIIGSIHAGIKEKLGGIFQADGEGFSNEDGYHILWQFPDDVDGLWSMAVLSASDEWICFEMNLGNESHRKAFWAGKLPKGIKEIKK